MAKIEALYSQLKDKRLTKEHIDMFTQYIKEDCNKENELKDELIYIINDYNKIIDTAMKLYETIRLSNDNNDNHNDNQIVNHTITNHSTINDRDSKPQEDLIKMKMTNSILKQIEFTRKNPRIFTTKYSNGDYKEFLNNLINYNYSISTLSSISNDIKKYDHSFKSEGHASMSPRLLKKREMEPYSFDKSLRDYYTIPKSLNDQMRNLDKKPFDTHTTEYGNYFDKKLNTYSQII